eukprot:TRINITY_DN5417_c0_g1_i3.p2 TRINITY_DN5417_c0_g1~~TRINITY_DN5417_c0_g1_i3.p2  ORF type:complete len:109 (+),score=19.03 TRINITY_DN5417_c0_g1_i3:48-329(+)
MVVQSNPTATMTTSFGTLKIEIFENDVPETAGNFIDLIEKGFYNGLRFFDSKPNYTFSAGCPNSGVGAKQKKLTDDRLRRTRPRNRIQKPAHG